MIFLFMAMLYCAYREMQWNKINRSYHHDVVGKIVKSDFSDMENGYIYDVCFKYRGQIFYQIIKSSIEFRVNDEVDCELVMGTLRLKKDANDKSNATPSLLNSRTLVLLCISLITLALTKFVKNEVQILLFIICGMAVFCFFTHKKIKEIQDSSFQNQGRAVAMKAKIYKVCPEMVLYRRHRQSSYKWVYHAIIKYNDHQGFPRIGSVVIGESYDVSKFFINPSKALEECPEAPYGPGDFIHVTYYALSRKIAY